MVSVRLFPSGKEEAELDGVAVRLLSQCRTLGSNNSEMHRPPPRILSRSAGTHPITVPLYLSGQRSKSFTATTFRL